jgi:hypothetical protein
MTLDDLQKQWSAQSALIDELIRINQRLLLAQALRPVRASLRWSQAEDVLEAVLAALCLLGTGAFIGQHHTEPRFWLPGAAFHLWFIGTLVVAVSRCVRKAAIQYDAPVLVLQRQIEALQVFSLRSLRVLFVSGLVVWGAPFCIVAARAWFNWDLYAVPGARMVLYIILGTSVLLGVLTLAACTFLATHLSHRPVVQHLARNLAGYNLKVAQERLEKLARLGREET